MTAKKKLMVYYKIILNRMESRKGMIILQKKKMRQQIVRKMSEIKHEAEGER